MPTINFPRTITFTDPARFAENRQARGELQSALLKLKLPIAVSDLARKEMGASTQEASGRFSRKRSCR